MNTKLSAVALGVSAVALLVASLGSISTVTRGPKPDAATQIQLVRATETIRVQLDDLERRNADLRAALTTAERRLQNVESAHATTETQLETVSNQVAKLEESATDTRSTGFSFGGRRTTTRLGTQTTAPDSEEETDEEPKLEDFLRIEMDVINGVLGPHIILEGANLHVRSGSGATDDLGGPPLGLGNIIIGYNELGGTLRARSGSHNLIIGADHGFSSFAGLIAGISNEVNEPNCSVTGGSGNQANGWASSISGGQGNLATADFSSVTGGLENQAVAKNASVTGGVGNVASGLASSVTGGQRNIAIGNFSSVAGGADNQSLASSCTIAGGISETEDLVGHTRTGQFHVLPTGQL